MLSKLYYIINNILYLIKLFKIFFSSQHLRLITKVAYDITSMTSNWTKTKAQSFLEYLGLKNIYRDVLLYSIKFTSVIY